MTLTLVMIKNNTGRPVQLTDNNSLSSINNKGTSFSHEWNFAHVDFLFFNIANVASSCFLIYIINNKRTVIFRGAAKVIPR